MLKQDDDQKTWVPYVIGMAATAIVSALGTELVKWGIDELKNKYGSKQKDTDKEESK